MHDASILPRAVLVRDWQPDLPAGTLRAVTLHWTAGDYGTVFPAYHFCLSGTTEVFVHATHDLRANMRALQPVEATRYAAHTLGRNSFNAGIAMCAMRDATPQNFGTYAVTAAQIDALCLVTARIVRHYGITIANVRTHAEAALDDGYFGSGADDQRWDIARLTPSSTPLMPAEAFAVGQWLRERIAQWG